MRNEQVQGMGNFAGASALCAALCGPPIAARRTLLDREDAAVRMQPRSEGLAMSPPHDGAIHLSRCVASRRRDAEMRKSKRAQRAKDHTAIASGALHSHRQPFSPPPCLSERAPPATATTVPFLTQTSAARLLAPRSPLPHPHVRPSQSIVRGDCCCSSSSCRCGGVAQEDCGGPALCGCCGPFPRLLVCLSCGGAHARSP